jgi:hypothetical protein
MYEPIDHDNGGSRSIATIEMIANDTSVTQALWQCATGGECCVSIFLAQE